MHLYAASLIHPLLAAYRGYGWAWWWWWWIVLVFVWLLLLPPFGWGRRWYGGYRSRAGGVVPPAGSATLEEEWQAIQARFVSSPAGAVIEADTLAVQTLSARGIRPESVAAYRSAHDIAVKAQQGNATTDELRSAMMSYQSLLAHG